jgi:transcriptional regulator with XRE-family HTH domain
LSTKKTKKFVSPAITARIKEIVGPDKKAFAKKSGISYEVIRLWWNGDYLPTVEFLLKLNKCNIDINWLLTGKDQQNNFMCGWPDEVVRVCNELKEILDYGEKDEKESVLSSIKQAKKIRELKKPGAGTSSERRRKSIK